jgi:hypothetical protein
MKFHTGGNKVKELDGVEFFSNNYWSLRQILNPPLLMGVYYCHLSLQQAKGITFQYDPPTVISVS